MTTEANTFLSNDAIAKIEARASKASRGPWSQSALANAYVVGGLADDFPVVCALAEYNPDGTLYLEFPNAENNMAFVAHAREDIPALCATLKTLRAQLEESEAHNRVIRERLVIADGVYDERGEYTMHAQTAIHRATSDLQRRLSEVERERDDAYQRGYDDGCHATRAAIKLGKG